jgi:hypothetical protein
MNELGFQSELLQYHCIVHEQNLSGKALGLKIMSDIFSSVNFIGSRELKHRQFKTFFDDVRSEYADIVYEYQFRWLSKDKFL